MKFACFPGTEPSEVDAEEARLHAMLETLQRKGGRAADRARLRKRLEGAGLGPWTAAGTAAGGPVG